MITYKVGYYFSEDDIKDVKIYNEYDKAFHDYIDRVKNDFDKLGYIPTSLAIGYYENNEYIKGEKLVFEQID